MKLESIHIENFQAHKDVQVTFGDRITCITGASDRGKSAILRALIWVMTNRPTGDSFIRHGSDEARVTVCVDGHTVQRIKGKKRNIYILDDVEFKAIKSDVPDEIASLFNVGETNIQQQFDPLFWFSSTAGEVGRNLNKIVNLDIIDYTLSVLQTQNKQLKTEADILAGLIEEQERILDNVEEITTIQKIIDRVSDIEKQYGECLDQADKLKTSIQELKSVSGYLERAEKWEESQRQLDILTNQYIELVDQLSRLETTIRDVASLNDIIRQTEVSKPLFVIADRALTGNEQLKNVRKEFKKLANLLEDLKDAEKTIADAVLKANEAEEELHQILDNNICPLCGRGEQK